MIDEKRYNERAKRIYKYQRIAGRNVKINDTSIESRLMAVPIIQALISGMPAFILIVSPFIFYSIKQISEAPITPLRIRDVHAIS